MDYMDIKTAASLWNLSERRLTMLCRAARIDGAKKEGGIWLIPCNAPKPVDGRRRKAHAPENQGQKLPLPIGISDFKKLVTDYYYVDKTLFLKDFLDARPLVSLFTRPRRFGKTLTMDMLKTFFEKTEEDTSVYFRDKKIWSCGKQYYEHQGKYPVIFLSFKDVKFSSWEETFRIIKKLIAMEFLRHNELMFSSKLNEYEKEQVSLFSKEMADEVEYQMSLRILTLYLHKHYGIAPIIIIDEYDTPIQQGHLNGFYDKVVSFMRNLFSGGLKDNSHLSYGFLTGILRVAKESIFSGLNNLKVYSILDNRFSKYFGFTKEEIREILQYYGKTERYNEICEWYDGYRFGETEIFNPWSVLNYMDENCTAAAYWQSTGDNSIIRQIVAEADDETADNLRKLMQGQLVSSYVDMSVIYPEIKNNPTTIYSFLLSAGYLKIVNQDALYDGNSICDVAIPNREIFYVYEKEILSALSNVISPSAAIAIQQAIVKQNVPKLQELLQELLLTSVSSFDYAHENFYHGLILGICAIMNNLYHMDSNRESGYGRYDIQLRPIDEHLPGIIIELKVLKDGISEEHLETELERFAQIALNQIDEKQYVTAMKQDGITQFFKIGAAFYKKHVKLISQIES